MTKNTIDVDRIKLIFVILDNDNGYNSPLFINSMKTKIWSTDDDDD